MKNKTDKKGHLYFVGLGLIPREHVTIESLVALSGCDRIFAIDLTKDDIQLITPYRGRATIEKVISSKARDIINRIAGHLVREEVVAIVTFGHPLYFGSIASDLVAICRRADVPWTSFGAVSPLGVALSAVGVTLGTSIWGIQAFEHRAFVRNKPIINRTWPTVIYFFDEANSESVRGCVRAISKVFGQSYSCRWCVELGDNSVTPLELYREAHLVTRGHVLYLPAPDKASTKLGRTEAHQVLGHGKRVPESVRQ